MRTASCDFTFGTVCSSAVQDRSMYKRRDRGRSPPLLIRRPGFEAPFIPLEIFSVAPLSIMTRRGRRPWRSRLVLWLHGNRRPVVPDVAIAAVERQQATFRFYLTAVLIFVMQEDE